MSNPIVNTNTLIIPMVEALEAVEIVEELATLDGVDSLLERKWRRAWPSKEFRPRLTA